MSYASIVFSVGIFGILFSLAISYYATYAKKPQWHEVAVETAGRCVFLLIISLILFACKL
jgi:hypothetical protein